YGKTDDEVFPPETAAQFQENDRQALASETGILTIETMEQEDGIAHHSIVSKFPILGPDGKAPMVGGIAIDITERKWAEERFRLVVEAAPNAIIMVGRDGKINLVNQQVEGLFGYAREELLGQPIEILVPERFRARHPVDRDSFFADPKARPMG